jgi:ribosomal protein L24
MTKETEQMEHDINIGDEIKVLKGEYKAEEGKVINVYNNTVAIEFNNILTKDKSKYRTVVKHDNYERLK